MCANQNEKRFAEILINSQLPEVAFNLNKSNESIDFTSFKQLLYGRPNLYVNILFTDIS